MANPAPTINQINAFNATQGTTIDFNIIGGTELIRSNRIYIYDLSDNSLICTHLYVSTESIHELPPNTDGSIVYESGKSSADFVNGAQYYAQIQTYTDTNGTQGGSGLSVAKMFWCLGDPTLTVTTIPSTISTTSYNISATYTDTSASVVSNIIQQYQFNLYSATGSLLQSSGVVVGSGTQQGTSAVYDISHNFTGLNVGSSYYVTVDVTTTQGMSVNAQSGTFTVSIDTPTLGEATVVNNACDGYISVTSNLSGEYGGNGSGEIVSFKTDSEDIFTKLQVDLEPIQEGSGTPSPSNVRPIRGHSGVDVNVVGKNFCNGTAYKCGINTGIAFIMGNIPLTSPYTNGTQFQGVGFICNLKGGETYALSTDVDGFENRIFWALYETIEDASNINNNIKHGASEAPTITTDTDCVLVFMRYADTAQVVTWTYAQVELGSTATPYEPYQQPQTITQDFNVTLTPTSTDTTPYLFKAVGDVYGDRLEDKIVGGTVAWNQLFKAVSVLGASDWRVYDSSKGSISYANGELTYTFSTVCSNQWDNCICSSNFVKNKNHILLITQEIYVPKACNVNASYFQGNIPKATSVGWNRVETIQKANESHHGEVKYNIFGISNPSESGYEVGDTYKIKNAMLIDLTQMFGSTIADYIYSLEQATEGAGVAWFKKLFPNDYYAYNAGELLSVEGLSAHVMRDADNNVIGNYPLDSSLTLRGIPKLDASNNLYYDGDEYTSDGKVKRKYGVVDLGTLDWARYSDGAGYFAVSETKIPLKPKRPVNSSTKANAICSKYVVEPTSNIYLPGFIDKSIGFHTNGALIAQDTAYTNATTFKAAMSGVMLVYELATPTTQTATPYTNPQIVSKYGTLEYVTNSIVPVGHKTTYLTRDIFGGYVDLISGKLVVTYKGVNLGDLTWESRESTGGTGLFVGRMPTDYKWASSVQAICSSYEYKGYIGSTATALATLGNGGCGLYWNNTVEEYYYPFLYICNEAFAGNTGEQVKAAMNGVQLVYELATPQTYQLTPQQVNTLVGTNNVWSEQGNIELSYHIPITNLLVKRQDVDDVSGGWLTLYSQPITQASDMDFTFIDFLNQYGKTYKYALVPLLTQTQSGVEVEVEGGYTVSNEVQSVFDGVFIADSTGSQKCKANVGYGNVDMNQVVGSITPIGAKYPIIITNSHNQYHNGSISGTIVPDDYYFNGNLSRIDMVNKRNELEQFLTNKRVKVIKDWNGNIWLVMIAGNVSCTFNNNYGMGIVSFSTNWTEVGDPTNQQDLQATGLINVGGV